MIFKRKTPNKLTDLMVDYVNSNLPSGVICREALGDSEENSIVVFSNTTALKFPFDISDGYNVKELSDSDKLHLNRTVVLPALKQLDKELFDLHKRIDSKVKELEKI